jgi:hypothetical protein
MSQHKEQQGYVTFAQNTDTVDYLELAYIQALNIKATQEENKYAVIIDAATKEKLSEKHCSVFDYVIDIPHDYNDPSSTWKLANEWQVFNLTPFKETIKLEADLLFTRSIDHWWTAFRLKNMVLATGCRDYRDVQSRVRKYRQFFDDNKLPDVYNGLMYFRYSREVVDFHRTVGVLMANWHEVSSMLLNYREETQYPSTDILYAVAAMLVGVDTCTMPSMDFINFVHMKPAINGLPETEQVSEAYLTEFDKGMIRINNVNQLSPVHYYEKDFVTNEMKQWYESRVTRST